MTPIPGRWLCRSGARNLVRSIQALGARRPKGVYAKRNKIFCGAVIVAAQ